MKANHNMDSIKVGLVVVVVNISKSKNESKSQHIMVIESDIESCGKYQ